MTTHMTKISSCSYITWLNVLRDKLRGFGPVCVTFCHKYESSSDLLRIRPTSDMSCPTIVLCTRWRWEYF
uniref:FBA_2 domain-containing protein n=1 Tax=Caenorhabditis tropicalis TaxID=1561998 RepID=A0A1I7UH82_9PELO